MLSRERGSFLSFAALVLALLSCNISVQGSQAVRTSQVILIDFSKSFAPLSKADERAITDIALATADLAQHEWPGSVSLLWSPIQSASLISRPICGPLQFEQRLIKRDEDIDPRTLSKILLRCVESTVQKSSSVYEQSSFTDITGAVALAAEQGQAALERKYIIVISDFQEDLPPGKTSTRLHLNGEHVLLLHRSGSQEKSPGALASHMRRLTKWVETLGQAGAASVVALPLASVTRERLKRALGSRKKLGTDVVVLQSMPDTSDPKVLKTISDGLREAARNWNSPVTISWSALGEAPEIVWQMPPIEFIPRLIKDTEERGQERFQTELNECAEGMQRFPGALRHDLASVVRFYALAGALDLDHIFVIISSFPQPIQAFHESPIELKGVRVVMLSAPNRADAADQHAYVRRVKDWELWFRDRQASVCRLPLNGLTRSSLLGCLHGR